jgi:uncharacterized protein (DUF488 family)
MTDIPIYTIGYGAREIDDLLAALKANDITFLLDVRSKPYSRYKPDFSKDALAHHLEQAGVRYVFMGDTLGGQPEDRDCYTDDKVDYAKVEQKAFYKQGIERLQKAYRQQLRVVLMCSEGKPEMCHRSKLIGQTLTVLGIPVMHIDEADRLIGQADVLLRLNKGQPSLFGDDFQEFTSRKRYQEDAE